MSGIKVFAAAQPGLPLFESSNPAAIAATLGEIGVRFERWEARHEIPPGASEETVIDAYRSQVDALMEREGYVKVDTVSVSPETPGKEELRAKFLREHTHAEDEVRFFVAGKGLFALHVGGKVYEVLCERSDLISIPANTRHWFDMGPEPRLVAIRLFNNPEGWVAQFTGSDIAAGFSRLDS